MMVSFVVHLRVYISAKSANKMINVRRDTPKSIAAGGGCTPQYGTGEGYVGRREDGRVARVAATNFGHPLEMRNATARLRVA